MLKPMAALLSGSNFCKITKFTDKYSNWL